MDFKEFSTKVRKAATKKDFKVTHCHTTKLYWRWLKKNKWFDLCCPVTERQSGIIIKEINKYFLEKLLQGKDVKLPHHMGTLCIRKIPQKVQFVDGKLKIPYRPNWKETLKLWYEDASAYKDKVLIRHESDVRYKIVYKFSEAIYENKSFYAFVPTRSFKLALKKKCLTDNFDVLPIK